MMSDAPKSDEELGPLRFQVALIDPRWRVGHMMGNVAVELLHPIAGPIHALLSSKCARELAQLLQANADATDFPTTTGRAQ